MSNNLVNYSQNLGVYPKSISLDQFRYHEVQQKLWDERHRVRFALIHAGRRSGKTEIGKRRLAEAGALPAWKGAPYFAAAPTRSQAKRIWWNDLKKYTKPIQSRKPSEGELIIYTVSAAEIHVVGLDVPERLEGVPWAGGVVTEVANCKPKMWQENMRPALSTEGREGWCWLEGVPEGKNWVDVLASDAMKLNKGGWFNKWGVYHWHSADIMSPEEVEAARATLDPLTFRQEYGGEFVAFQGRAYYGYSLLNKRISEYDPDRELIFCFDFNISPGVCAIVQEFEYGTQVIGEVYIPRNSTTPAVCDRLILDWEKHRGPVACYGDSTGGAGGSAKVSGSDWDIIQRKLRAVFKNLRFRVPKMNPREKSRVNAMNSRLHSASKEVRLFVDTAKAPHVDHDLEYVRRLEGGSGEIDKKHDKTLTHISDALGYYIAIEYPVRPEYDDETTVQQAIATSEPTF